MEFTGEVQYLKQYELTYRTTDIEALTITNSQSAADAFRKVWNSDLNITESFYLITLNTANVTTGFRLVSTGGITGCVVDVRIVAKYCIEALATACIVAHNHPSGRTNPSTPDISLTKKLNEALRILDVKLLDHIIMTKDSHYSFADNAMMI